MKTFESFDDIEKELKKLALEKEIALEELKIVKHDFEHVLKPINWLNSILNVASKYGFFMLLKKVFK